jgi:hypothetical protein
MRSGAAALPLTLTAVLFWVSDHDSQGCARLFSLPFGKGLKPWHVSALGKKSFMMGTLVILT